MIENVIEHLGFIMKHVIHPPCSWYYDENETSKGIYLRPIDDPIIKDIFLPLHSVEPVPVHSIRRKKDFKEIFFSENLVNAIDFEKKYNSQNNIPKSDSAKLYKYWDHRLPEGKFQVSKESNTLKIVQGEDLSNSALVCTNLESSYNCTIKLDSKICSNQLVAVKIKYNSNITRIYIATVLEVGQSFAYQNFAGFFHRAKRDAYLYTWNGNTLEEKNLLLLNGEKSENS